jgi:hypothetical protein
MVMVWTDHSVPFHRSATGLVPSVFSYSPTAIHDVVEGHDTPLRMLLLAPPGFGVLWMDHSVPFQRSAKVTCVPELLT